MTTSTPLYVHTCAHAHTHACTHTCTHAHTHTPYITFPRKKETENTVLGPMITFNICIMPTYPPTPKALCVHLTATFVLKHTHAHAHTHTHTVQSHPNTTQPLGSRGKRGQKKLDYT